MCMSIRAAFLLMRRNWRRKGGGLCRGSARGRRFARTAWRLNGKLTAHVAYRPLYRLSRSSSYYFDPLDVPAVREFVARFVRKIEYTGQISFDWIQGDDGRCAVLGVQSAGDQRCASLWLAGSIAGCFHERLRGVSSLAIKLLRWSFFFFFFFFFSAARLHAHAPGVLALGLSSALRAGRLGEWRRDFARGNDVLSESGDLQPSLRQRARLRSHVARAWARRCTVRDAAHATSNGMARCCPV